MPDLPSVKPPPAMGDCVSTFQPQQPGAPPLETAHKLIRSGDGKTRIDAGDISVITDPATKKSILLDHVKKQATSLTPPMPTPPGMQMPQMPHLTPPAMPGMQPPPITNVQDLGKRMIDGEMAEGKRITSQPPPLPGMPQMPNVPGMPQKPQMPGMPSAPQMPGMPPMPQMPQKPTVTDVWTNPDLHLPVLTQVTGDFGQQTCKCKNQAIPEPNPAMFQVPPGYKDLTNPQLPATPKIPR